MPETPNPLSVDYLAPKLKKMDVFIDDLFNAMPRDTPQDWKNLNTLDHLFGIVNGLMKEIEKIKGN